MCLWLNLFLVFVVRFVLSTNKLKINIFLSSIKLFIFIMFKAMANSVEVNSIVKKIDGGFYDVKLKIIIFLSTIKLFIFVMFKAMTNSSVEVNSIVKKIHGGFYVVCWVFQIIWGFSYHSLSISSKKISEIYQSICRHWLFVINTNLFGKAAYFLWSLKWKYFISIKHTFNVWVFFYKTDLDISNSENCLAACLK